MIQRIITILILILLTGCSLEATPTGPTSEPVVVLSPPDSPTPNSSNSPNSPNSPTPTFVPGPDLPVLAGTPVPIPNEPITPENVTQMTELATLAPRENQSVSISDLALSADGRIFIAYSVDPNEQLPSINGIYVWNIYTGQIQRMFETAGSVLKLALSTDGNRLISSSVVQYSVSLWDVTTGQLIEPDLARTVTVVYSLAISPDGRLVTSAGSRGGGFGLYDVQKIWPPLHDFTHDENEYGGTEMAFSPDGTKIVSVGWKGRVHLWDVKTGELLHRLIMPQRHGSGLAFSADGYIVAALGTQTIWLWDVETGTTLHKLETQTDRGFSLAFSPNGLLLASGARNDRIISESGKEIPTIQLWDVKTGKLLHTLDYTSSVSKVVFSHDGKLLISGASDGTVQMWSVPSAH